MEKTIACIGNLTRDYLFWVDKLPELDDVSTVRNYRECFGGRGAIVTCILSALGCSTNLINTIPNSELESLKDFFNSRKGSISSIEIDEKANNYNKVFVTIGKHEENCTSLYFSGDCNKIVPTQRQYSIIDKAEFVYFTSHEIVTSIEILKSININKHCVIVNISSYMLKSYEYLKLLLEKAEIIIGNQLEFKTLLSELGISLYVDIFKHFERLRYFIVTLGADGVYFHSRENVEIRLPALKALVKTPVGIGDAFVSGIIYGEFHGLSPDMSLKIGLKLAAVSIESEESCPTYDEIINSVPTL